MPKCCISGPMRKNQRRVNGLQLPLNWHQIICWIVLLLTAGINLAVLVPIQFDELKYLSIAVFTILYITHIAAHITAMIIDPSEKDLWKREVYVLPEFDRTVHAHVIENGRCHLCNINTSNKKTKHCGICNKCVFYFDHHCMWLNNCIGQRNYSAFIVCVVSALLLTLYTISLCITDIVYFYTNHQNLSKITQNFIKCTSILNGVVGVMYCKNAMLFIIFLIIYCLCAVSIGYALLHLACFHVYIRILGVSTYEYIVKTSNRSPKTSCCRNKMKNIYLVNFNKNSNANEAKDKENNGNNESSVSHLINVVINNEFLKAKRIVLQDSNKIHPSTGN